MESWRGRVMGRVVMFLRGGCLSWIIPYFPGSLYLPGVRYVGAWRCHGME